MEPNEIRSALALFTGTQNYYPHESGLNYTDGVAFLAENAGAYWLLDLIASYQKRCRKDRSLRDFQIWKLVKTGKKADVICLRDSDDEAFRQHIPFTDFPLDEVTLYLENEVLLLPGEH
jgi:hypothetical protein